MSDGAPIYQPYPGNEQAMQMNQNPEVAQPNMAPQGMAPQVMPPQYSNPLGPQYSTPQSMAPQGMGEYPGMGINTPPNIIIPAGLPQGLAGLATLKEVRIHQLLKIAETYVENNQYEIRNNQDYKFMFAKEDTDCCTRQCCGTRRPFALHVTDNLGNPVMMMNRPYRCQASCLWCCCLQEMEIQSPPGVLQGTVIQAWTCWTPKYRAYNSQNQCVFTIVGEFCYCKCCADVVFQVFDGDREEKEVAQIIKHYGGCNELCSAANDFSLRFMADLDLMQKMLLLGAIFLIDYNYFERNHNPKFIVRLILRAVLAR